MPPTGNPGRCSPVYPGRKPTSRFCAAFAITLIEHGSRAERRFKRGTEREAGNRV